MKRIEIGDNFIKQPIWIFNCKLYCPLSVALFRYVSYLIKIVENWWSPFDHDQKCEYREAAIDKSYWHLFQPEKELLHQDDLNNTIWNTEVVIIKGHKN